MNTVYRKAQTLLRLLNQAFGEYRWKIGAMVLLSGLSSVLEGMGINSVIPLFSFVDNSEPSDSISKAISKAFLYFHIPYSIKYLLIFIAALFISKAWISFVSKYLTTQVTADYEKNTRSELFQTILSSNWPYLSKQKVGNLDQILITDLGQVSGFLSHLTSSASIVMNLIVYGFIVINISFLVAALSLSLGLLILVIFRSFYFQSRIAAGETEKGYKNLAHYINENIIGIKTVKSFFVEKPVFQRAMGYFERLSQLRIKAETLRNVTDVVLQPMGIFFIIGVFAVLHKTSSFQLASFAVMVYAINKMFVNVQIIQGEAHNLNSRIPYFLSVLRYRDEALTWKEKDEGERKFSFQNNLEFKQVAFSYDSAEMVLKEVNFSVPNGAMIGLVGSSGAGKTTVVDLLLRLLRPREGNILLDREDIANISLKEWRTNVGYVSQDIFLMNDTIFNNIRFYDDSLSAKDVVEAAKMANIYEFIKSLPRQFETVVGERGVRLSGGQRQRIALARVLARSPKILILDEATSALDNESEILIQEAIAGLKGKITVIAIAHRLSTILDFDKVVVLDGGKIIEQGVPRELLQDTNSHFYKVYNLKK